MIQKGLASYFYELCVLFDNNNINNHHEPSPPLLIRNHLVIFLCFLVVPWLKLLISSIPFTWSSEMLHESPILIVIVLWIWLLLPSGLNRSSSVRLYLMILFQYLYCHSPGVIDWFSLIMLKLDRSELFESIIFDFFAVLLSFFLFFISTTCLLAHLLAALLLAAPAPLMLLYCLTHLLSPSCTPAVFSALNASIMIHKCFLLI